MGSSSPIFGVKIKNLWVATTQCCCCGGGGGGVPHHGLNKSQKSCNFSKTFRGQWSHLEAILLMDKKSTLNHRTSAKRCRTKIGYKLPQPQLVSLPDFHFANQRYHPPTTNQCDVFSSSGRSYPPVKSDIDTQNRLGWKDMHFPNHHFWYLYVGFQGCTLQGINISSKNGILKIIFLFPRWDMLIPWRVIVSFNWWNLRKVFPSSKSFLSSPHFTTFQFVLVENTARWIDPGLPRILWNF